MKKPLSESQIPKLARAICVTLGNNSGRLTTDKSGRAVLERIATGDCFIIPDQVMDYLLTNDLISLKDSCKGKLH